VNPQRNTVFRSGNAGQGKGARPCAAASKLTTSGNHLRASLITVYIFLAIVSNSKPTNAYRLQILR
jgi:hypothetical protein